MLRTLQCHPQLVAQCSPTFPPRARASGAVKRRYRKLDHSGPVWRVIFSKRHFSSTGRYDSRYSMRIAFGIWTSDN